MQKKIIYNPGTNETLNERRVFGGNPDGMINFTRMKYEWALRLWDTMEANTWFPKEVAMNGDAKDYKILTEVEKRMYDLVLSQLIFMDSLQANNLMDNINPYITAPEINACLSRQSYEECLVPETEVLTDKGWKQIKDVTLDDNVLTCNSETESKFSKPLKIHKYEFNGMLNKIEGRYISQVVTDDHRMLLINRNNDSLVKKAGKLAEQSNKIYYDIPLSPQWFESSSFKGLSPYKKLLIAIQADGTIHREEVKEDGSIVYKNRNGNKSKEIKVTFSFAKLRKKIRLIGLLNTLSFRYTVKKYSKDKHLITAYIPRHLNLSKKFTDTFDLSKMNKRSCEEFIDELTRWDGWDYSNLTVGYDTTDKENADFVMAVGTLAGYRVRCKIDPDDRKDTYKDLYRLSFSKNKIVSKRGTVNITKVNYEGNVHCLTVEGGFFVVRHNNKISITGNCNHSKSYAVMVESISDNTDLIYDMWKNDPKLREKNDYIAEVYKNLTSNGEDISDREILLAMFANQILEGIYFYAGFAAMYALGKSGKMLGSSQMIKFIQRDEITHLLLFQNMINSTRKERPELFTPELEETVRAMFRKAVELEAGWGAYITQGQILGFTDKIIEQYIQYLADRRLEAVGYKAEYGVSHPIPWVDGYSSFNDQRSNFFEFSVTNYSKGSISFDDF